MSTSQERNPKTTTRIISVIAIVSGLAGVVILAIFTIILVKNYDLNGEILPTETGIVGDFIGGIVGTLWTLTSVLLFYLALKYQREDIELQSKAIKYQSKEIKLQRKELKLQREEMVLTREALQTQSDTMLLQKFETTFFNLINNHSKILDSLALRSGEINGRENDSYGQGAINCIYIDVKRKIVALQKWISEKQISLSIKYLNNYPEEIVNSLVDYEDLYENANLIINFISKSAVHDKEFYQRVFINSISTAENFLLGFTLEYKSNLKNVEFYKKTYFNYFEEHNILASTQLPIKLELVACFVPTSTRKCEEISFGIKNCDDKDLKLTKIQVFNKIKENDLVFLNEELELNLFLGKTLNIKPFLGKSTLWNSSCLKMKDNFFLTFRFTIESKLESYNFTSDHRFDNDYKRGILLISP